MRNEMSELDYVMHDRIVERARALNEKICPGRRFAEVTLRQMLVAVHHELGWRYHDLLHARDNDFSHDTLGALNYYQWEEGTFRLEFRPKFAARQ